MNSQRDKIRDFLRVTNWVLAMFRCVLGSGCMLSLPISKAHVISVGTKIDIYNIGDTLVGTLVGTYLTERTQYLCSDA